MEFISLINDGGYSGAKVTSSYAREIQTSSAAHILGMVGPIYAEDDMEALRAFGIDVVNRRGKGGGWYLGERTFQLAVFLDVVLKIAEGYRPPGVEGGVELVHRVINALVHGLDAVGDVDRAV